VAAYYAVSEALANAAKHARASAVHVELDTPDTIVRLAIRDDGIGGADPARGFRAGRAQRPHRGARRHARSHQPPGGGTALLIEIPVDSRSNPGAPEP
jgi:nitrate/nitrite-specific signal transduction histidine kinase